MGTTMTTPKPCPSSGSVEDVTPNATDKLRDLEAERDALKAEVDAETARADRAEWLHDHAPTGKQPGPHPACGCDYCKLGADLARLRADYGELIMAVMNKYPGETRHQTALRLIQEAERHGCPRQAALKEGA